MTIPSKNGGDAATNVPVKPLRREGIRCKKLSRGSRSYPGIETIPAAGLSTTVARAGVVVRPASANGRDPCRLRPRYRSSGVTNVQHLQLALLDSRSLSWQRPTTRDKWYDLISYVKKSKINTAMHFGDEEFQSRRGSDLLRLHRRVFVYFWRSQLAFCWTRCEEFRFKTEDLWCVLEVNDHC